MGIWFATPAGPTGYLFAYAAASTARTRLVMPKTASATPVAALEAIANYYRGDDDYGD